MVCPCRDCENRGCGAYHDVCTKYQEYRKYWDNRKVNKMKESEIRHILAVMARTRRNRK